MSKTDKELLKRLLEAFGAEAEEDLTAISSGLVELENVDSADMSQSVLETVYRQAHSLKGAARAVELVGIEDACQNMETFFSSLKEGTARVSPEVFDLLHQVVDTMLRAVRGPVGSDATLSPQQVRDLRTAAQGRTPSAFGRTRQPVVESDAEPADEVGADEVPPCDGEPVEASRDLPNGESRESLSASATAKVPTAKLDTLFMQVEEMLGVKLNGEQRRLELLDLLAQVDALVHEWDGIRKRARNIVSEKDAVAVDARSAVLEFLQNGQAKLRDTRHALASTLDAASQDNRSLSGMLGALLDDMKSVLMLPFAFLVEVFPKMVRDISRDQGKNVELSVTGKEVEIDKRILEEMRAPLIHLVRNAIDHGVEKPYEREQEGKPRRGKVVIRVSQVEGDKVSITVSDDGAGIDIDALRRAVVERGVVPAEEVDAMGRDEVLGLLFRSGVSTSPIITDLSGRGLGMAIVRESVTSLGGTLHVETEVGSGTTFTIVLPVTLSTYRGVLVRAGGQVFVVPTLGVDRVLRLPREDIRSVEGKPAFSYDGGVIPLVEMAAVLGLASPPEAAESPFVQAIVLGAGADRIAFRIEDVLSEQEVLVKGLGAQLRSVRNVAGATVLGTGEAIPILNVHDLLNPAAGVAQTRSEESVEAPAAAVKSVLVVEDSITSRMLIKSILEAAGYRVETAVDGVAGLTALRQDDFDLLVSDVDMPRMSGLELAAAVRADERLGDVPIILVTSLGSREDRERGIEVGANAYIVKSSFDQGNLLETVQRLI